MVAYCCDIRRIKQIRECCLLAIINIRRLTVTLLYRELHYTTLSLINVLYQIEIVL